MNRLKWILYSFCVVASMVLLAHAFIPHVHHNGMTCFIKGDICNTYCCHHNHENHPGHDNGHDHGPLENCQLGDIQIRPEVNESLNPDLTDQFLLTFHLIFFPTELILLEETLSSPWQYPPYQPLYTSVLADSSLSLRAPPVLS